jgi:hypothetical protein
MAMARHGRKRLNQHVQLDLQVKLQVAVIDPQNVEVNQANLLQTGIAEHAKHRVFSNRMFQNSHVPSSGIRINK